MRKREPTYHSLKCWPENFSPLMSYKKTFEIRKNDRDFRAGDYLLINEYDPNKKLYTGRMEKRKVSYLTDFKQRKGYIVMGLQ